MHNDLFDTHLITYLVMQGSDTSVNCFSILSTKWETYGPGTRQNYMTVSLEQHKIMKGEAGAPTK